MDKTVKVSAEFLKSLGLNASSLHWRRARKAHPCKVCKETIPAGSGYYQVVHAGAGLRDMKFPDRICCDCVEGNRG